ncbi:MAG TPA: hypothetical protein VFG23_25685, partial [Polyangia bacterium]|nr:hypothetical protein [Polyangia bacterium]
KMKERREFVERFGGEERPNLEADIDYRRKRGMLEEINRAAREIETEEGEMDAIRVKDAMDESGPVDLPVGPGGPGPLSAPVSGSAPGDGPAPGPSPASGAPAPSPSSPGGSGNPRSP